MLPCDERLTSGRRKRVIMRRAPAFLPLPLAAAIAAQAFHSPLAIASGPKNVPHDVAPPLGHEGAAASDSWNWYGWSTGVDVSMYEVDGEYPAYQVDLYPADTGATVFTYLLEFPPSGHAVVTLWGPDVYAVHGAPEGNILPDFNGLLSIGAYADALAEGLELAMAGPGSPLVGQASFQVSFESSVVSLTEEVLEKMPKESFEWDEANIPPDPGEGGGGGGKRTGNGGSIGKGNSIGDVTSKRRATHGKFDVQRDFTKHMMGT